MKSMIKQLGRVFLVSMAAIFGASFITWYAQATDNTESVILAGGCFWCVESDFDNVPGVLDTVSGYTGGSVNDPTYKIVTAGGSGHLEAVKITFDPDIVTYQELLEIFWRSVDPTDDGGQFCDRGESYKTAIFVNSPEQRQDAEISKELIEASGALKGSIVTPIIDATTFYPSEEYHQDYYTKNPIRYKYYRYRCGRDERVREVWGDQAYRGISEH
ncbi:peptide-methionine (S)-S-oxide reductase MsrA [Sneathiella marina]|uniref:Peptide methionine sulfoxide reductase MsrA n=1 Tax=Sneathiella marina TaxID=2950108 RepID=A0ABY4W4F2_9PROT|nr:peptide-methionine (S)-S-oxide reductase MsrA [Sneathiella marina]USG61852.1 peptide-methionine (S)-S-oxide reductase MsrA [Sneathiella marina]